MITLRSCLGENILTHRYQYYSIKYFGCLINCNYYNCKKDNVKQSLPFDLFFKSFFIIPLHQVVKGTHRCGRIDHKLIHGQTQADPERVEQILKHFKLRYAELEPGKSEISQYSF